MGRFAQSRLVAMVAQKVGVWLVICVVNRVIFAYDIFVLFLCSNLVSVKFARKEERL